MTASSTELPFPNCVNSASAGLLKEYYRPKCDIPGFQLYFRFAATSDVHALRPVLTLSAITGHSSSSRGGLSCRNYRRSPSCNRASVVGHRTSEDRKPEHMRRIHRDWNRDMISQVACDGVIDTAYDWLCRRRRDYPSDVDVWDHRFRWRETKGAIQADLLNGTYCFSPLNRVTNQDGVILTL